MERTMSVEDKIRRAEEIYNRKRENQARQTTKVNINSKKDIKLLKKMIIQIILCLAIYSAFYLLTKNNFVFSEDLVNKTNEILSYDIDFQKIYEQCMNGINSFIENNNIEKNNGENNITENENSESNSEKQENENAENNLGVQENKNSEDNSVQQENKEQNIQNSPEENIGGSSEENVNNAENIEQENSSQEQETREVSQMEQDSIDIRNSISFISPIEGSITSTFGWRNPTTSTVPKNHTGLDIATSKGTVIKSATNGTVILASSKGDYGNHLKIQIDDVTIINYM